MKNKLLAFLCIIFVITGCVQTTNEISQVANFKKSGWYQEVLSKLERCVVGLPGQAISTDLIITVFIELNQDGNIKRTPNQDGSFKLGLLSKAKGGTKNEQSRYSRQMTRAVTRCAPYDFLPKEKFDEWASFSVDFIPSDIFQ